jgi:hypothetical protein
MNLFNNKNDYYFHVIKMTGCIVLEAEQSKAQLSDTVICGRNHSLCLNLDFDQCLSSLHQRLSHLL